MGFFKDLRADISQAVNELLPDEEYFSLEEGTEEQKDRGENQLEQKDESVDSFLAELEAMSQKENENSEQEDSFDLDVLQGMLQSVDDGAMGEKEMTQNEVVETEDDILVALEQLQEIQPVTEEKENSALELNDIAKLVESLPVEEEDAFVEEQGNEEICKDDTEEIIGEEILQPELVEEVLPESSQEELSGVDDTFVNAETKAEDDADAILDTLDLPENDFEELLSMIETEEITSEETEELVSEETEELVSEETEELLNEETEETTSEEAEEITSEETEEITSEEIKETGEEVSPIMDMEEEQTISSIDETQEFISDDNEKTEEMNEVSEMEEMVKENSMVDDIIEEKPFDTFEMEKPEIEDSVVKNEETTSIDFSDIGSDAENNSEDETTDMPGQNDLGLDDASFTEVDNNKEKEDETMENNLENSELRDEVTVITKGTIINGSISADGSLEVNGTITGDVSCLGKLTINGNVSGHLKAAEVVVSTPRLAGGIDSEGDVKVCVGTIVIGDVTANSATIAGAVKGDINVPGAVVVDSTAIVQGNINAKSVQINNGAVVDGYCKLSYAEVDIDDFFKDEQ